MNFSELYTSNREAVERVLWKMWTDNPANDSQRAYNEQMKAVIGNIFAPNEAMPVVQCMNSYKSVSSVSPTVAESLVGDLWQKALPRDKDGNIKYYPPYEHQYQSWHTLLEEKSPEGKPMSIVVTTGTGSGKTECFMMPLVEDLNKNRATDAVQAIFLYPLNALMEDQKERLEKLLTGTDLTYTVYNGDLPEREPKPDDNTKAASRLRRKIDEIRGAYIDKDGTKKYRFPKMLYTRQMVRKTPPNILLTNPTMLEYILLRKSDMKLTDKTSKSLKWIAIDETHTYTGAGAAELAMLLRRVMLAYGVDPHDVQFATSSATFGNTSTPEEKKEEEGKLREFIAGIAGIDVDQVKAVNGERVGVEKIPDNEDRGRWQMTCNSEYISLDRLFPGGTIAEKLQALDDMCRRADAIPGLSMKVKVHYFYRVPNNGLYVRLTQHENGAFKIYTQNTISAKDGDDSPILELCKCKHCGEYVAIARLNTVNREYEPVTPDDKDMFDLIEDENDEDETKYVIIGLSNNPNQKGDNNGAYIAEGNKLTVATPGSYDPNDWHLVANTQCKCPFCNAKQTKSKDQDEDTADLERSYLRKFRMKPDLISRIIAPSILDQLDKPEPEEGKFMLHDGQQYLSFVDSRQAAAQATIRQNIEEEKLWVYSVIFNELNRRALAQQTAKERIASLRMKLKSASVDEMIDIVPQIKQLESSMKSFMSWSEIAELLKNDIHCPIYCLSFAKRSSDSEELDEDGNLKTQVMEQYVQAMMVEYLAHRPASAAAPETMGLFQSHYEDLNRLQVPETVEVFNALLDNEENKINRQEWQDLIQLYLDYNVRNNQSIFLKLGEDNPLDIQKAVRFATEKPRRRPAKKPTIETPNRILGMLVGLLAKDKGPQPPSVIIKRFGHEIQGVIDALWTALTDESHLIEQSEHWDETEKCFVPDGRENSFRMNVAKLGFKLYDEVYLCDTNTNAGTRHTVMLRPVGTFFKSFSPYLSENQATELNEKYHEFWKPSIATPSTSISELREWAKVNRKVLWDNGLWGEDGEFTDRLESIYLTPKLFIQAEHTAQVDKTVSRKLQKDFKEHTINILACSTTMEMGVDLGNLEVVVLSSVPPLPSNYKQRSGRSGRNNKVRSACITLCGSDAIGLRTLFNPIEKIISRPVAVPTIDLKSPQVVQRHVNSFLVRYFGVFSSGANGGNLSQRIVDYYSPFQSQFVKGQLEITDSDNRRVDPDQGLGSENGTMYAKFNDCCTQALSDELKEELAQLLKGTIFDGQIEYVVAKAKEANERCYDELKLKLEDYRYAFVNASGPSKEKFLNKLRFQYGEVMGTRLLDYWATSRFTPNANMPVSVLSLDINFIKDTNGVTASSSNPSYSLREAIGQYVPGNDVVVDGVVYTVRGVEWSKRYESPNSFKTIYHNADKTVIDDKEALSSRQLWPVNGKEGLELIQPKGFLPDKNEINSRILQANEFTRVSAQLIDADEWVNSVKEPHLFSVRNNRDTGTAKILYYNEGIGYGFCFCSNCGKMVMESERAEDSTPPRLPEGLNDRKPKDPEKPMYHRAISGRDYEKPCSGSYHPDKIRRNVIIGDLILTDYSEIRIRHKGKKRWISERDAEENLLFTLGIVFTQSLVDILGRERGAVDFAITPTGHICIFDTNPGGAGYANQLSNIQLMMDVVKASKKILQQAKERDSKDMLLDKFTLRFLKFIDIDGALAWIKEEEESRSSLPENIAVQFKTSTPTLTTLSALEKAFKDSYQPSTLFVDDNFATWDYGDPENGWRGHLLSQFIARGPMTTFCVARNLNRPMNEPILQMCRSIKEWCNGITEIENPFIGKEIYPIAYIDGCLYFTNDEEFSSLNDKWGNSTLYCVRTSNPGDGAPKVDCSYRPSTKLFTLSPESDGQIQSKGLGKLIQSKAGGIIEQFIAHCKESDGKLKIWYQDEHLKSVLGMVTTMQVVEYFVKEIGKDFILAFNMEKYEDSSLRQGIASNMRDYRMRDDHLELLADPWLEMLEDDYSIIGEVEINSQERKTLTHWRELSIECNGKRLSIYPDGGFINGWSLRTPCSKRYELENTDTDDNIPLRLTQDIKYDVAVEDVQ